MVRKIEIPHAQHMRVLKYRANRIPIRKIVQLEHLSYGMVTRLLDRMPVDLGRTPYRLQPPASEYLKCERYWRERLPAEHKRASTLTVGGCGSGTPRKKRRTRYCRKWT